MKIRPLVSLALFGAAACQPDKQSRSGPATETRDSAGIRIVENAKPQEGSRVWRVASEPAVSIGEHEGEDPYLLYQVWDATKLPDGLDIFEIGEDYVLGQSSDEMNVEFVQVWPLER
ncbi:MAG: hypothetical protein OXK74_09965 [Gemmatimonadota bacterium]|nr:hypothetical protein [Gemmatimonadota bacterium]